jgi:hypothetical protein
MEISSDLNPEGVYIVRGQEDSMTIVRARKVVAVYRDDEVLCSSCAAGERRSHPREESLPAEELEGIIDTLWCDRCGGEIFSFQ